MKGQLFSMDFVVSVGILGIILAVTLHAAQFSQSYTTPSDKAYAVSEALMKGKLSALSIPADQYGYRYSTTPTQTLGTVLEYNFDVSCLHGRNVVRRMGHCPAQGNVCYLEVRVCA